MNNAFILTKPHEKYFPAIQSYKQDFLDSGDELGHGDCALQHIDDLSAWLSYNRALENHENAESSWTAFDQYLYVRQSDGCVVGMINYRRADNDAQLADYAGNMGYAVRPSERRKGYAKAMLKACLNQCFERGIDDIVIACDKSNDASKRLIMACGGVFERFSVEDADAERYILKSQRT